MYTGNHTTDLDPNTPSGSESPSVLDDAMRELKRVMINDFGKALAPNDAGDFDAKSKKIINVTNPASIQDAATKGYVDTQLSSYTGTTGMNTAISNALSAYLPRGAIIMWSGSAASIPVGWVLCNGGNGTPNLMDRFVIGAGSSFGPGAVGGTSTHGHWIDPPNTATSASIGETVGLHDDGTGQFYVPGSGHYHHVDIAPFTSDQANHIPPFYALCFIMKL